MGVSVADTSKREWPNPLAYLIFGVTPNRYPDSEVRVDYTTVNGTAVVGKDYKRRSGTLVFSEDDRTQPLATRHTGGRASDSTSIPPGTP